MSENVMPKKTLMGEKYFAMLFGGTMTLVVTAIMMISDSVIAGMLIGSRAVAGITIVKPIYSATVFLSSIFAFGIPVQYGNAMGQFDRKRADRIFGFGLLVSVGMGIALFARSLFSEELYFSRYRLTNEILDHARSYFFWLRFTILLMPLRTYLNEMVHNDGDEQATLSAGLVQGLGTITLSVYLCRSYGLYGIGFSAFFFSAVAILILSMHFFKRSNSLHPKPFFSFNLVYKTVQYSMTDAASYLFMAILTASLNYFVTKTFGTDELVLVSVISLYAEFQLVYDGVGEAITPIISIYWTERCTTGIKKIYSLARRSAIAEGLGEMLIMIVLAPFIPRILGVTDPELSAAATRGFWIMSVGALSVSVLFLLTSYYLIIEKLMLGVVIAALRDCLLSVPFAILLGNYFGLEGMFWGMAIGPALALAGTLVYLRVRYDEDAPLLLSDFMKGREGLLFELELGPDSIIRTRDRIGERLTSMDIPPKAVNRVMLLFEELTMLLFEKNTRKDILCECVIVIGEDKIRMIVRDSGDVIDITDPNLEVTSLRSYVVANIAEQVTYKKRHLVAMSFNRNVFEIKV